jgi:hypothetical protein
MDFETTLKTLLAEFERRPIRYAVIGGFAMGALGVSRTTVDLDFLVHHEDVPTLHDILSRLGYERRISNENVSQYTAQDKRLGAIDVVHAFRPISLKMLEQSQSHKLFGEKVSIRILLPEDVIGLKIQAIANNPSRQHTDTADIETLMELHGRHLDWERLLDYYELFDMMPVGESMKKKYGPA